MYLKNLQMIGFKSFVDKTSIEFLPGVLAIVGPNGCGKSNILDAIRWVLGEQSAKALRGNEMADVIFNGTDTRKSVGMAEVSLTFAECKDILKTGQLAGMETNFEEVTMTRRVFRDGNSDYLINKTPCRLKDVHSLFMDTGIGRPSYSLMEQGKIDKVLSSNPEDRRTIFEEAAGITRFKVQKKEALRKLEYTEANLVRVVDIIREVKRQIGSLQRQVGKARRYQSLTEEIKHLDSQLARHEFEGIQSAIQLLEEETAKLKTKIEDLRLEAEASEGNITNLREQLAGAENQRQQVLQRQRDIQSEIERHEIHVRTNTDRIAEAHTAIQTKEQEASETRARLVGLQNQFTEIQVQLGEAREKMVRQTVDFNQSQKTLQEAEKMEHEHGNVVQRLQNTLFELEGGLGNLRNRLTTLGKHHQELDLKLQKLNGERVLASEERQKLLQRQESFQTEIKSYKITFEASRHAVTGGEDALREAEQECQIFVSKIAEDQRLLSEKTSRRDVLRQLQESYEGYSEGAQVLLRQLSEKTLGKEITASPSEVLGTLASFMEVEPRFSAAIEAGLGQALQSIIVSQCQTALDLVEQLRKRDLGCASFVIKEEIPKDISAASAHKKSPPTSLGWASEAVRGEPVILELVRSLLADMVLVSDLRQAMELHRHYPKLTWITIHGDVFDRHGILWGGSHRASPRQLISRRNEVASLDAEITQLEKHLHELSVSKGEWEGRRALARQSLGDRQSELRFQENDLTKKEAFLGAMQSELRELDSRVANTHLEIQDLERQQKENEADLAHGRQELAQIEIKRTAVQSELGVAQQQAEKIVTERHHRSTTANDLRVGHATIQQQIHHLESQFQPLENQIAEGRKFVASREAEIQTTRQRTFQWQKESTEVSHRIQTLRDSAAGINDQITKIEKEKARLESEIQATIGALREFRTRVDDLQRQLTDHEIRLTEKRGDLEHLCDRIFREYNVDLKAIPLFPLKGNGETPKLGSVSPIESRGSPFLDFSNWDEVTLRVAELRAKIQNLGPVNLEAVQEYDELEQRHTFLTREHDDLVLSKQQLLEILRKINVTTRKMFFETFEKIRQNFQSVFTELFGGGKADLILMDENDPLECGIEIVAKPPGKHLQSILLLSGGERAMTAVSLLFAIYMVKPSPFCVLDEMDAPLDESNINRFVKMLERFLVHSQFLIITHNKRTIAMADALYGVTMEERGISKVISVKFHQKNPSAGTMGSVSDDKNRIETSVPNQETSSRFLVETSSHSKSFKD